MKKTRWIKENGEQFENLATPEFLLSKAFKSGEEERDLEYVTTDSHVGSASVAHESGDKAPRVQVGPRRHPGLGGKGRVQCNERGGEVVLQIDKVKRV